MVTNVTSSSPVIATGGTKLSTQQIKNRFIKEYVIITLLFLTYIKIF